MIAKLFYLHLLLLPFAAVKELGPLGNISKNLSFYSLACLILLCAFSQGVSIFTKLGDDRATQRFNRLFLGLLLWCALCSIIMSLYFGSTGVQNKYDVNFLMHTVTRTVAPLFLAATYIVSFFCARYCAENNSMTRALLGVTIFIVGYGALQQIYLIGLFPWYEKIAVIVESGRYWFEMPYIEKTGRSNLTLYEPAEAAKFILLIGIMLLGILPSLLSKQLKLLLALSLLILLFLTKASSGYLVLVAALIFYVLNERGQKRVMIILTAITALLISGLAVAMLGADLTSLDSIRYLAYEKLVSVDSSESTRTRYAFITASVGLLLDYPIFGIGWGKEIFLIENYFPRWGWNWETTRNFESGTSLTAMSMLFRIAMYGGVVGVALLLFNVFSYGHALYKAKREATSGIFNASLAFIFLFFVFNSIDGGIITSIYQWTFLGIVVAITDEKLSKLRPHAESTQRSNTNNGYEFPLPNIPAFYARFNKAKTTEYKQRQIRLAEIEAIEEAYSSQAEVRSTLEVSPDLDLSTGSSMFELQTAAAIDRCQQGNPNPEIYKSLAAAPDFDLSVDIDASESQASSDSDTDQDANTKPDLDLSVDTSPDLDLSVDTDGDGYKIAKPTSCRLCAKESELSDRKIEALTLTSTQADGLNSRNPDHYDQTNQSTNGESDSPTPESTSTSLLDIDL